MKDKMSKRCAALVMWLRRAERAEKICRFNRSPLRWGRDESLNRLVHNMFIGWEGIPVGDRAKEVKSLLRHVSAHPIHKLIGSMFPTDNATDVVYHLCGAVYDACCQTQQQVNHAVNSTLSGRMGSTLHLRHLLEESPNRRLSALKKGVDDARKIEESCDGFRDIEKSHPVRVEWKGRMVARSYREQVGACARAQGVTRWEFFPGWEDLLTSSEWPRFVTEPRTDTTWMEII